MLNVTQCAVCDGNERAPLITFPDDPYLRRLSTRNTYEVSYVVCQSCGFVYQDRMMDAGEMAELYGGRYREVEPPSSYLDQNRAVAMEIFSWITAHTGLRGPGPSVLDIGCATGMFLRPFVQTGWQAVGLDSGSSWIEYGRRAFGLDLRDEFFTAASFPGRTFDLILFSHVLEHVLDPAPVLAAIREKLADGGYLFLGTPDVLSPKRKLYPGLFGGDHVRLFSPRTLAAYLQRHGFRIVQSGTFPPRGLRVLAVKGEPARPAAGRARDDWRVILPLFRGLMAPERATRLERNLAALVEYQWPVLEEVSRGLSGSPYEITFQDGEADNVAGRRADGSRLWLYGKEGSRSRADRLASRVADRLTKTVVVQGLGLGHLAERLDASLDRDCRIHVWEPDLQLFAAAVHHRDLSGLFLSPRVWLHLGPSLEFMAELAGYRERFSLSFVKDPVSSEARHPLCGELDAWVEAFKHLVRPLPEAREALSAT